MVMTAQKPGRDSKGREWATYRCPDCGKTTVQWETASAVLCSKTVIHKHHNNVRMVK